MKPTHPCIVTGKPTTTKFFSPTIKVLYQNRCKGDIELARKFLEDDFKFIEEYDVYCHRLWPRARTTLMKLKITDDEINEVFKNYYPTYQQCSFPGCGNKLVWNPTHLIPDHYKKCVDTCCITHYNQSKHISNGKYTLEDLKYKCHIDNLSFLRLEDVTDHLITHYNYDETDLENYYLTYVWSEGDSSGQCLWCDSEIPFFNIHQGYRDFCHNSDCSVLWHNKHEDRATKAGGNISKTKQEKPQNNPTRVEYWVNQGFTETAAARKLIERQTTNSVDAIQKRNKCSRVEAETIRRNITEKWIKSCPNINYSLVSQRLFWSIQRKLDLDIDDVFFATFNRGVEVEGSKNNREYKVKTEKSYRLIDFYVKSKNKAIEFDGEYWHNKKGARELDLLREREIRDAIGCTTLRIDEVDYNKNPDEVVQRCIDFLKD